MAIKARQRVPAVDVLQTDFEYCTVSYYAEGTKNNLGEPTRTLTQRATNVRCSIDALTRAPAYVTRSGLRDVIQQGIVESNAYIITLLMDATIEPGDVVTDCDGVNYDVIYVMNWHTHKEAFLRKVTRD